MKQQWVNVCRGNGLLEEVVYMDTLGNRALKDFTDDALTVSVGSLFQKGTARMLKAYWRRRVQQLYWRGRDALCGLDV